MKLILTDRERLTIYCRINSVIGWVMFLGGVFFDKIAEKFLIQHSAGFGALQYVWVIFWGLYLIITDFYNRYYGK